MKEEYFAFLVDAALKEDLEDGGDVTSQAIFTEEKGTALLKSKARGVLAGSELFSSVFSRVDREIKVDFFFQDGSELAEGDTVAEVEGSLKNILIAERTGINFLAYLSGIATQTRLFVQKAAKLGNTVILDTRKTLPGYRYLAKYAVAAGGGTNHRMGLYDMVMIKDNHIDAAGSITDAVRKVKDLYGGEYTIEVECRNMDEVKEALKVGADIIMLDNMDARTASEAVSLRQGAVRFEVSGNMDLERIAEYAGIGVDYISVGSITHSVRAFDFSLILPKKGG